MGGIEQTIHQIALGTHSLGVDNDVLFLSAQTGQATIDMGAYQAHRSRLHMQIASTGISASVFFRFMQLAKRADIIHYHFPWPFMDVVHFAARVRQPTLVTYHSDIVRQQKLLTIYRPLQNKFLESMHAIVVTSPNYLATSPVLGQYQDKIKVIPIGLNKASYPQPSPGKLEFWRQQFGSRFFLFIGVLRYYKGLHILIEAAKQTGFPVVIVGAGPIEHELRKQAAALNLQNVYFLGFLAEEDKVALLELCYAVIFPSHLRSEAFGISLLEGAMFGKALISAEIGTGTSFINMDKETGLVVPPSNPEALSQAMTYLWHHPQEVRAMGECARLRYQQYFTADIMAKKYVQLYGEITQKHPGCS
jgi:rhamnosyl/mannosyltransferase